MNDEQIVREVAEKVMGWYLQDEMVLVNTGKEVKGYFTKEGFICYEKDFYPLTNLNHAFMVVEKMREDGWVEVHICQHFSGSWKVTFWHENGSVVNEQHDNLGHAICLAALKAVELKS